MLNLGVMFLLQIISTILVINVFCSEVPCAEYLIVERWRNGWKGNINIPIPKDTNKWKIDATFDRKIQAGDFWAGQKFWSKDRLSVRVLGNDWSARHNGGDVFRTGFTVNYNEHGPEVNFKTLEITLCWADNSGCETCSPLAQEPEECQGGFQGVEENGGRREGRVQIMSTECYSNVPDIVLTFSRDVGHIGVSSNHSASCTGNECIISGDQKVGINELILVSVTFPSQNKVTGVLFAGRQMCDVIPVEMDLSLDPTLEPGLFTVSARTTESEPLDECARYDIVETWQNGWKGELHIPIRKDTSRWRLDAEFNKPVVADFWAGLPERWSNDRRRVTVLGHDWSATQTAGTVFRTGFTANHKEKDQVFIKWMTLKLCWVTGGCVTCHIVKEQCPNPLLNLSQPTNILDIAITTVSGEFSRVVTECSNDMPPLKIEFSTRVKRMVVGRGRYQAACAAHTCTISTVKPLKMIAGTRLRIKFRADFWGKAGNVVGLHYGEEDVCHS